MSKKHSLIISPFIVIFFILFCTVFTGCGQSPYPQGFPKIYPCEITVTQEGTPLEGATVTALTEDDNLAKWPVGGTTDASGKANLTTMGKFKGVPAGTYTILISKTEVSGPADTSDSVSVQSVPAGREAPQGHRHHRGPGDLQQRHPPESGLRGPQQGGEPL